MTSTDYPRSHGQHRLHPADEGGGRSATHLIASLTGQAPSAKSRTWRWERILGDIGEAAASPIGVRALVLWSAGMVFLLANIVFLLVSAL